MTRAQAGRIGGLSTFKKYGKTHMQTIGKNGAKTTWGLYVLKPVGQSQYAMVNRKTNAIKTIVNSNNFSWHM
jgi:hypothetical protein